MSGSDLSIFLFSSTSNIICNGEDVFEIEDFKAFAFVAALDGLLVLLAFVVALEFEAILNLLGVSLVIVVP